MTNIDLQETENLDASALLRFALETYGDRAAIGTSLQKTGIVTIDLAHRLKMPFRVFFIDTRSNPPETYELMKEVEQHFGLEIERYAPTDEELESLYRNFGQHAHFLDRTSCCRTRKQIPLQRAITSLDAWIAGLRADQSSHRREKGQKVAWVDEDNRKILKINPLFDWTEKEVDEYTREHGLPYNKLYNYISPYGERYTTIGCEQCHIPVPVHFGTRAGKFPWEQGKKECGLHRDGSGI